MLNEGLIVNDTAALVLSEIVHQIRRLGPCKSDDLERAVFESLVGHTREEVDWDIEGNQAGYFLWTKTFDRLITELINDGYIQVKEKENGKVLVAAETDPDLAVSQVVYPPES